MKLLRYFSLFLSTYFFSQGLFAQNQKQLDSLNLLLSAAQTDSARVNALREISFLYDDAGNPKMNVMYLQKALGLSRNKGYKWGVMATLMDLAQEYIWEGKGSELTKSLNEADKIAHEIKDLKGEGKIQYIWSKYYKETGDFEKSVIYALNSIKMLENIHDDDLISNLYSHLGNVYNKMNQAGKALEYYKKAYVVDSGYNNRRLMATDINNLGMAYGDLKNFSLAVYYLKKSIEIKKEFGNINWIAGSLNTLGSVYVEMGKQDDALDVFFQALKIKEKAKDHKGIAISCINIGGIYTEQKKYKEAIEYFNRSVNEARIIKNIDIIQEDYKGLSEAYSGEKSMSKAYDFLQKYIQLKDSIYNESSNHQITEMQTKYESDKKEQENKLLQTQNLVSEGTIHQQKIISYFIGAGLLLSVALAFFIFRGYRQKQKANEIITQQKQTVEEKSLIVEEKNKEILDSIHYAKRIQRALLTSDNYLKKVLPEHFILYKPKDIVSGDFYWSIKHNEKVYYAAADCTGHGVPGAFMSLVGISFLNEILIEKNIFSPEKILDQLRSDIIHALNPEEATEESKDGMDIVLCCYDPAKQELSFAAANNPLYLIRKGILSEFKGDKFPVGKYHDDSTPFTLQTIPLQTGDCIYTFTDGFADQFGGPQGKKYKYKQLQEQFLKNHQLPLLEQKQILDKEMETWKGNLEQIDDILIIGIKI